MTTCRGQSSPGSATGLGRDWTARKLGELAQYLTNYTTVLRQRSLKKAYIDAFANAPLFPDLARTSFQTLLEGSARLSLKVRPRFDRYLFLDRHANRNLLLKELKLEFSDRAADIRIADGEANETLSRLCEQDWHHRRALLFLDPFGMQIEWSTIEAIGKTRAIDLWLFLPLGLGLGSPTGEAAGPLAVWRTQLDQLLGGRRWQEDFGRLESPSAWRGSEDEHVMAAAKDAIGRRLGERLIRPFAGVAGPTILRDVTDRPLYLVCFAAGSPRNLELGLRHAREWLDAIAMPNG